MKHILQIAAFFLVASGMKPGLLQIIPGTWLLITCHWLRVDEILEAP